MTTLKPSSIAIAFLFVAAPWAQAQDTVPNNVLVVGRETGVLYAVTTGLSASLCGIDAARATEAAGALSGALARSRLILCAAPEAEIDRFHLSPVTLAIQTPAATGAPAAAPTTQPAATAAAAAPAASGATQVEMQTSVRISVGGAILEVTPEQAAEACGIDLGTIGADASGVAAGAGDPVPATQTEAAGAAAPAVPAGSTAGIGSPAAAEEPVGQDAPTARDSAAIASEAICEISRDAAEAMGLPAPD